MFGRSNQDQRHPTQIPPTAGPAPIAPVAPIAPPPQPVATAAPEPVASQSVIGEDLAIIGQKITIITKGRVCVNGMIQGDINGKEVVIGPKGQVTGTVTANEVKIDGQVSGALKASSVTLSSTARVDGDICHHRLAIAEGAQFDGSVRRPRDESEITPILDPETVKAQSA